MLTESSCQIKRQEWTLGPGGRVRISPAPDETVGKELVLENLGPPQSTENPSQN